MILHGVTRGVDNWTGNIAQCDTRTRQCDTILRLVTLHGVTGGLDNILRLVTLHCVTQRLDNSWSATIITSMT